MQYIVLRNHIGDRPYSAGDIREAVEAEVSHLVRYGVLKPKAEAAQKSKPAARKKAAK